MKPAPAFEHAHAVAKHYMNEDFFYSPVEESGPFGSDDAADTFSGFRDWREKHDDADPLLFLEEQLYSWGYPHFDLHVTEAEIILNYCHAHELGSTFLSGMDAAVVAVAFGQLYLEGKINPSVSNLAIIAIDRELSPFLLHLWDENYQLVRSGQLQKMRTVLNSISNQT